MSDIPACIVQEICQIKINGCLDDKWSDWFNGFTKPHQGEKEG